MPIGDDSLNLVHLAPRRCCQRVLDLCTARRAGARGGALLRGHRRRHRRESARALRFVSFNAALNGLATKVATRLGDGYDALRRRPHRHPQRQPPRRPPAARPPPARPRHRSALLTPAAIRRRALRRVLASPPFVAVPPPPPARRLLSGRCTPTVARTAGVSSTQLSRAPHGAAAPRGHLAIVSEFPNIRRAHRTLAALGPSL